MFLILFSCIQLHFIATNKHQIIILINRCPQKLKLIMFNQCEKIILIAFQYILLFLSEYGLAINQKDLVSMISNVILRHYKGIGALNRILITQPKFIFQFNNLILIANPINLLELGQLLFIFFPHQQIGIKIRIV